jgi:putative ABC transport system permease protein
MRTLVKNPGFALVAIVTIGFGIGANTAIFSVVRGVILAPLPYEEADELVVLWGEMRNRDVLYFPSSPPDFKDYRDQADLLQGLAGVITFQQALTGDGEPAQIDVAGVTPNFFSVLGVQPLLGWDFVEEDGTPNDPNIQPGAPGAQPGMVLLSHALWQQRFGGDRGALGRTIEVGGAPGVIVGVMPEGLELLMPPEASVTSRPDLWVAMRLDYANSPRNNVFLRLVGRLGDGVTVQQAQAQVSTIAAALAEPDQTKTTAGYGMRVASLHRDLTAQVRPVLYSLLGAVVFVLLIACANVSNLLLARASGRAREMALRAALGGSRGMLLRQLLIESGVLAGAGAVVGLVLAAGGVRLLLGLHPDNLPRIDAVRLDGAVLAFTLVSAAGAALVFGLVPALQASQGVLAHALKERGQAGGGRTRQLLRNVMVVGEVALSLVLLIGAGLMVRSFVALNEARPGYEAEGVLAFEVSLPFAKYPRPIDRANLAEELQSRFSRIPGVTGASAAFPLPLAGALFNGRYGPEEALTDPEAFKQATYRSVLPGYFEAMGTRLLEGRTFTQAEMFDSTTFVVVDEKLARTLWPGASAVGRRFLVRAVTPEPEWVEVVGVVEHQRSESLAAEGMETVFFTDRYLGGFATSWVVRTTLDPLRLVPAVRAELEAVDGDLPMASIRPFGDDVARAMGPTRFALTLIGVFGVIALLLASVGLYGVLSYLVRQRTAEIGVRLALGAESGKIMRMVVGQGLVLAGTGVLVGLVAAVPLTGAMRSLLVEVSPNDTATFVAISGLFMLVAALACWVPGRRAAHLDPVNALREE